MRTIQQFLELYPKENSKKVNRAGVYKFLEFMFQFRRDGKRATKEEIANFESLAEKYFSCTQDHTDNIMRFAVSLNSLPPMTAKAYVGAIKEYLGYNDIEFTQRQLKMIRLKLPKGGVQTIEKDMDTDTIRKVMAHMDIKGKALIAVLASSGMRIGEALSITTDDIDLNKTPPVVTIRGGYTKTGEQRITFISKEAKEALIEWLKVREQYIKSAMNKNNGFVKNGIGKPKNGNDNRVFPFSESVVDQLFTNALSKAGILTIDDGTNRKQLRIHQLRKFFRSQLALGCPVDIVETLMGHEGYLTDAYRRYPKAQMAEHYLKHEYLLYIQMPKDVQRIESEFKTELNDNRKLVEKLILENQQLKADVGTLQEMVVLKGSDLTDMDKKYRDEIDKLTSELRDVKQYLREKYSS